MIIGVDAAVLGVTDDRLKTGVFQFVLNLLVNLSRTDKENKYLLYSFDPIPKNILKKLGPNWTNLVLQPKKGWLNLRLSIEFMKNKPDIFLGMGQALPFYHPAKNILFVYDLAFEINPKHYPKSSQRLSNQTKFAAKKSDRIIAISSATKNDLVRLYNIDPGKINVIYPGVNEKFKQLLNVDKRKIPYFLFVGSYKPSKNIPAIVKAFGLFLKEIKKPFELILAGSDYRMDNEILEIIQKLKLDKLVKLKGFVSEKDLIQLYKNAAAFVSPSFYEGFGIPHLEAMASGVPVITSNRGSILEVTGDAAIIVEPDDIESIKNPMVTLATDDKIRSKLRKTGYLQVQKFSWEKSAKKLLRLLH